MTRIGGTKRLIWGLGVIALGLLGALPFQRAPRPDAESSKRKPANNATLGNGVALRVPGQKIPPPTQTPDLQPMPDQDQTERASESKEAAVRPGLASGRSGLASVAAPPPQLPDHYYPLYRPDKHRRSGAGRVVSPDKDAGSEDHSPKTHTIRDGDTLRRLARRYLGDPGRADEILEANRTVLADPEVLPIGVEIVIPPAPAVPERAEKPDGAPEVEIRKLVPLPPMDLNKTAHPNYLHRPRAGGETFEN